MEKNQTEQSNEKKLEAWQEALLILQRIAERTGWAEKLNQIEVSDGRRNNF